MAVDDKFAIGALAGSKLSEKIKADYLKEILAWFIIIISAYVLYKQFQSINSSGMQ